MEAEPSSTKPAATSPSTSGPTGRPVCDQMHAAAQPNGPDGRGSLGQSSDCRSATAAPATTTCSAAGSIQRGFGSCRWLSQVRLREILDENRLTPVAILTALVCATAVDPMVDLHAPPLPGVGSVAEQGIGWHLLIERGRWVIDADADAETHRDG
jgi:hypothetical protein